MTGRYKAPQPVRDALNLVTLIRWVGRCRGSFTIARGNEDDWRVMILRGDSPKRAGMRTELIVFDDAHADISTIVDRAANAVKRAPEWEHWTANDDARRKKRPETRDTEIIQPRKHVGNDDCDGEEVDRQEVDRHGLVEYDYDIWSADQYKRGDYGTVAG